MTTDTIHFLSADEAQESEGSEMSEKVWLIHECRETGELLGLSVLKGSRTRVVYVEKDGSGWKRVDPMAALAARDAEIDRLREALGRIADNAGYTGDAARAVATRALKG